MVAFFSWESVGNAEILHFELLATLSFEAQIFRKTEFSEGLPNHHCPPSRQNSSYVIDTNLKFGKFSTLKDLTG